MTTRQNLNELLNVLEKIRSEKYPYVDKELVREVAIMQYDNQDKRGKGRAETQKIISDFLRKGENNASL